MDENRSAFVDNSNAFDKTIRPIPKPEKEIGIDTKEYLFHNIVQGVLNSTLDITKLENFSNVTRNREQTYQLIDTMAQDSKVASVLETYAEDTTEYNDAGRIVWVESSNPDISAYIDYLLRTLRVEKNIYKWAHSLCKYGDLYLRLYHKSDYEDQIFPDEKENDVLNEDVKLVAYKKSDRYVNYIEMVPNPAEVFELTMFGKTAGYIQVDAPLVMQQSSVTQQTASSLSSGLNKYSFHKNDVQIFGPKEFVHACLEDSTDRTVEEVDIFLNEDEDSPKVSYKVRKGQSILASSYKTWRELMLLENSILLNRVTKSSIIRVIGVEVGDMPKEMIGPHLQGIKSMVEQKASIDVGNGMNEYTNPGPIENNIYVPTHDGKGAISITNVGGDVNVKELADLDYYINSFYGGLRVPKQYFCLRGNTPILLLDGSTHTISELYENSDLFIGKEIMSCSIDGELSPTTISNIMLTKPLSVFIRIHLSNGNYVDVTSDHRMMLRDGSFMPAAQLIVGDSLMPDQGISGSEVLVEKIEYVNNIEPAYDIEVSSDNHTFVLPCGIFVHNCQTDDQTGFNGGTSLSIISSRYAKAVKRIQNTLVQAITDALNLMLLDAGLNNYINHFEIHMLPPTTQEEKDRRENVANRISLVRDIMDLVAEIDDVPTKLRILKVLLSEILTENEIPQILQQEIIRLQNEAVGDEEVSLEDDMGDAEIPSSGGGFDETSPMDFSDNSSGEETPPPPPSAEPTQSDETLPSPSDLGVDMTEM